MAKRLRQLSVLFAMVFFFSLAAPAQDAADPGSVKVPWEEFKKLLELGKDEIVLSWTEFRQILAQTEMKIVPAFELRDEKVVLTRAQFRSLLEKMKPPVPDGIARPAESLLRRSAYRGRLAGGAALVQADISADVFPATPGAFVNLSLFPGQVAVRDIRLNDLPALIVIRDGRYTVATAKAGPFFIGYCSTTSTGSCQNTRAVSRRSTGSSVRSSKKSLSATSTVAIPAAGSPASVARTVARSGS